MKPLIDAAFAGGASSPDVQGRLNRAFERLRSHPRERTVQPTFEAPMLDRYIAHGIPDDKENSALAQAHPLLVKLPQNGKNLMLRAGKWSAIFWDGVALVLAGIGLGFLVALGLEWI